MARAIPVDGPMGPEEPYSALMQRYFDVPGGCLVGFEHLPALGRTIVSRLDVTRVNPAATELAGGKTIYGDAVLFTNDEPGSG